MQVWGKLDVEQRKDGVKQGRYRVRDGLRWVCGDAGNGMGRCWEQASMDIG